MTDRYILQELITDDIPFRVHNVKIDKLICERDLPMMFLAHYDALPDDIKEKHPFKDFFGYANQQVTAQEACNILNIAQDALIPATHIKIIGTSVIVWDDFPLALHLSFTNTAKETQTLYGNSPTALIEQEAHKYLFCGNVNVLHKTHAKTLLSINLDDDEFHIPQHEHYTRLPNSHALATTHILNTLKDNAPQALGFLTEAITGKVMQVHETRL